MEINHRFVKNRLVVDMKKSDGSLMTDGIDDFIQELMSLAAESGNQVAINMSEVAYLNSSGLGELIMVKDRLTDEGISLVLISVTNKVISLLTMVGVDQFFSIIDSESDL